ncbi:MAG: glycosyltransferase family 4 protein [Planctomycetaceae bacterium]|jgi:glycosyltransferase involved in cell wall biosynthesis|nr:glycosyltransferase family 4 protein [Planctomycetaceae bacterium]
MTAKLRLIFDIANFSGQPTITGVPRYVLEVLKRFIETGKFEIVTICSLPEEEFALRNFRRFFYNELPFQSKEVANYVLPDKPFSEEKSWLKKVEDTLNHYFTDSWVLKWVADFCRAVKWKLSPPPFLSERKPSPFYKQLVRESDIYFSPFHPLIPELVENPNICKVLIVHDLIPVIFADVYKGHRFFQKNPWESITPDVIVFTDSESTKRDLLKYYPHVSSDQVTSALLGVDDRFVPCSNRSLINRVLEKYSIPTEIPYILSVATLDIRKNFDHVMNCFSRWLLPNRKTTDCYLVLTGSGGWQDKKFKKAYDHLPEPVKEKIIFTGYVDDADLPLLYSGAACFCYMSLYEGFGLPPLEAMKSGTPVITSNTSSLPEVVGDAGIMLDPHDENGLTDAFDRLLNEEPLRNKMIQKGLLRAKKFSWDQCIETMLSKIPN